MLNKDVLIRLYVDEKKSIHTIAKEYSVNYQRIWKLLQKYSIERRKGGSALSIDFTNKTIDQIKILSFEKIRQTKNRRTKIWKCLCLNCNQICYRSTTQLTKKQRQACFKCLMRLSSIHKDMAYGKVCYSYLYGIRKRAQKKNLMFDLDCKFLDELFIKQNQRCKLSGVLITLPEDWSLKKKNEYTASLDRIDSSKGYIKDNVQWVHKRINAMKLNMTDAEFIDWCNIVSNYHTGAK